MEDFGQKSYTYIDYTGRNKIRGVSGVCPVNGHVLSISAWLGGRSSQRIWDSDEKVKMAIYDSNGNFIAQTEEKYGNGISVDTKGDIVTFNFSTPPVVAENGTYFLVFMMYGPSIADTIGNMYFSDAGPYNKVSIDRTYSLGFPATITTTQGADPICIWATVAPDTYEHIVETVSFGVTPNNITLSKRTSLDVETANYTVTTNPVTFLSRFAHSIANASISVIANAVGFLKATVPWSVNTNIKKKRYLYKIYDADGIYIRTWSKDMILSAPEFSTSINSGPGQLTIDIARLESNYGENKDIKYGNRLKIFCFDKDSGDDGVVVYSGVLSGYVPFIKGSEEGVKVTFLSHTWECGRMMLLNGNATTVSYLSQDPSDIMRDLIDKFNARGGSITYEVSSIDDTSTTVSYTFNTNTFLEAMKKVLELSPLGWYFRVDPSDDLVHMHEKNESADHKLVLGKHISEYQPEKRIENIVNVVYFVGDGIFKKYQNLTSIAEYGEYSTKYIDQRVSVAGTADIIANRILDSQSSPEIRVVIKVLDNNGQMDGNGYDIESLKVGQTVKIKNATSKSDNRWDDIEWDVDAWDYSITNAPGIALQIMSIDYTPEYAVLELSNRLPDIAKRIEDINRNFVDSLTVDNPSTPTV